MSTRPPVLALGLQEREQVGIDLVCMSSAHTVRRPRIDLQRGTLDELGLEQAGVGERHDLVGVALQDERRYVELLQVLGLICFRERLDAVVRTLDGDLHSLEPERVPNALRNLGVRLVVAVERHAQILEELGAVRDDAGPNLVKDRDGQTSGIVLRLRHEEGHLGDQYNRRRALATVPALMLKTENNPGGLPISV